MPSVLKSSANAPPPLLLKPAPKLSGCVSLTIQPYMIGQTSRINQYRTLAPYLIGVGGVEAIG